MSMEDFDMSYEEAGMPYMKASVDIPLQLLKDDVESVNNQLYKFFDTITNGKLLVSVRFADDGNCCFEANKNVSNENDKGEYDIEITNADDCIKIILFKLEEAGIVHAKHNGLIYLVNLKE